MNRLANLALSVGEPLVHETGRRLFGLAPGRAKEFLGTPQPLGTRQLALNRALQKKAVDGALLAGPRTEKEYAKFTIVTAMPEGGDPEEFYRAIIHDPRGLPWSEGVVVKYGDSLDQWFKVKANDTLDVRVIRCLEGSGKFAGSLGAMVVEGLTGVESEIGSFQLSNEQRRWIRDHRDVLTGQVAEVRALKVNESGAIRAGVLVRFHPSKSEQGSTLPLLANETGTPFLDPDRAGVGRKIQKLESKAGKQLQLLGDEC